MKILIVPTVTFIAQYPKYLDKPAIGFIDTFVTNFNYVQGTNTLCISIVFVSIKIRSKLLDG